MKPSDVRIFHRSWLPLVDTFGRSEIEWAAALLVRTCELNGDVFAAHLPRAIGETMKRDFHDDAVGRDAKRMSVVRRKAQVD